jgi:4-amino-4-deoxy-L-arabinose transferase-like glycosyltransferase
MCERKVSRRCPAIAILCVLAAHAALLAHSATVHSPSYNEIGHLPAGISHWVLRRYDLYAVNPPLVRSVAAVPVLLGNAKLEWRRYREGIASRPELVVGVDFINANGQRWIWLFIISRWACIPFSLLGAWICYRWTRDLYGEASGFVAMCLWCFSPNILANASMITPDVGASAFGLAACYIFWHWLKSRSWSNAFLSGLMLGLAELAKMTWIILFLLWPVMWLLWRRLNRDSIHETANQTSGRFRHQSWQLAFVLLLGLYVLNVGYGFDVSFQRLGHYKFGSRTLAGKDNIVDGGEGGNRFRGTWLEYIPVPLPREYLRGMDLQKIDFERKKSSYLNGEWKKGGWWYYYVEAVALKVPLGYWLIGFTAAFMTFWDARYRKRWKDEIILLLPPAAVFILVSSQTGFSRYLRYILPCFPFAFIWCSKVAQSWQWNQKRVSSVAAIGLAWGVGSSLWVFPHSMSYFNELAGGPNGGYRYLLDANIDWGQDLFYFKDWYEEHPEARPIFTDFYTFIDDQYFGIDSQRTPDESTEWYAVSVHKLFGRSGRYEWLWKNHEPVAKAGYSIWIFHVPIDEQRQ